MEIVLRICFIKIIQTKQNKQSKNKIQYGLGVSQLQRDSLNEWV